MNQGTHLLSLNLDSNKAVERIMDRLTADGMEVIRSFDLLSAKATQVNCTCPKHGNDDCDCQLVVLLVYDNRGTMLTMVAHGKDNKTHFALVDPPNHALQKLLRNKIMGALALVGFASIRHSGG
jgi:hypothetical protein